MAVFGTAAYTLLLALSAAEPSLSDMERSYLSTRDEHIRKIEVDGAKSGLDVFEADKRALRRLEEMLQNIIGPVDLPDVSGPGKINLETLIKEMGFGNLDGLSFNWGGDALVVTTPGLLDRWLATRNRGQVKRTDLVSLSGTDGFYTGVFGSDAACDPFGSIPVSRPQASTIALASLAVYAQDDGPWVPTDVVVFVARGNRVFVVDSRIDPPLDPIAACEDEWKQHQDYGAYRRCYWRTISDREVLASLVQKAQAIVDATGGGSETSAYEQCLGKEIAPEPPVRERTACSSFYVRHEGVVMHERPDGNSDSVRGLRWGQTVAIDWKATKAGPRGWMRVSLGIEGIEGWVAAKDLAGTADFRRVRACWPVEAINLSKGDHSGLFTMDTHGSVKSPDGDGSVWFTKDLLVFGSPRRSLGIFGYAPSSRRLFSSAVGPIPPSDKDDIPDNHVRFQPDSQLRGCEAGFEVVSHSRP